VNSVSAGDGNLRFMLADYPMLPFIGLLDAAYSCHHNRIFFDWSRFSTERGVNDICWLQGLRQWTSPNVDAKTLCAIISNDSNVCVTRTTLSLIRSGHPYPPVVEVALLHGMLVLQLSPQVCQYSGCGIETLFHEEMCLHSSFFVVHNSFLP
jgi:hypothetical protein